MTEPVASPLLLREPRNPLRRHDGRVAGGLLLAGAAALLLPALKPYDSATALAERKVALMGTTLEVAVRAPAREAALAAADQAIAEVRRVEDLLTTWRDASPLARVNHAPPGEAVAIPAELTELLSEVFDWSRRTGGAFDPTVLPLVEAWGLRAKGRIPSAPELEVALRATGLDRFRLDAARKTVTRRNASAGIDEGAWGKGYALDRAAEKLRKARVPAATLNLGGKILAFGEAPEQKEWTADLAHPRERSRPVAVLRLQDIAVSTSGDSERSPVVDGRRVGHLLDPRTGQPAPDFGSATVAAPTALVADILSTALFVLGPAEGLALSERLRAQGTVHEVLFLVERAGRLEAVHSPGFPSLVLSADPGVVGLTSTAP